LGCQSPRTMQSPHHVSEEEKRRSNSSIAVMARSTLEGKFKASDRANLCEAESDSIGGAALYHQP
jgi:hypothetical protein